MIKFLERVSSDFELMSNGLLYWIIVASILFCPIAALSYRAGETILGNTLIMFFVIGGIALPMLYIFLDDD